MPSPKKETTLGSILDSHYTRDSASGRLIHAHKQQSLVSEKDFQKALKYTTFDTESTRSLVSEAVKEATAPIVKGLQESLHNATAEYTAHHEGAMKALREEIRANLESFKAELHSEMHASSSAMAASYSALQSEVKGLEENSSSLMRDVVQRASVLEQTALQHSAEMKAKFAEYEEKTSAELKNLSQLEVHVQSETQALVKLEDQVKKDIATVQQNTKILDVATLEDQIVSTQQGLTEVAHEQGNVKEEVEQVKQELSSSHHIVVDEHSHSPSISMPHHHKSEAEKILIELAEKIGHGGAGSPINIEVNPVINAGPAAVAPALPQQPSAEFTYPAISEPFQYPQDTIAPPFQQQAIPETCPPDALEEYLENEKFGQNILLSLRDTAIAHELYKKTGAQNTEGFKTMQTNLTALRTKLSETADLQAQTALTEQIVQLEEDRNNYKENYEFYEANKGKAEEEYFEKIKAIAKEICSYVSRKNSLVIPCGEGIKAPPPKSGFAKVAGMLSLQVHKKKSTPEEALTTIIREEFKDDPEKGKLLRSEIPCNEDWLNIHEFAVERHVPGEHIRDLKSAYFK